MQIKSRTLKNHANLYGKQVFLLKKRVTWNGKLLLNKSGRNFEWIAMGCSKFIAIGFCKDRIRRTGSEITLGILMDAREAILATVSLDFQRVCSFKSKGSRLTELIQFTPYRWSFSKLFCYSNAPRWVHFPKRAVICSAKISPDCGFVKFYSH